MAVSTRRLGIEPNLAVKKDDKYDQLAVKISVHPQGVREVNTNSFILKEVYALKKKNTAV